MMIDGGLRKLFKDNLKAVHFQSIESGGTGLGVPDTNGCHQGIEFWVEFKQTAGWTVSTFRPEQVAWIEQRTRHRGRVHVGVRQRGAGRDALWLLGPGSARMLIDGCRLDRLPDSLVRGHWPSSPWPWPEVLVALTS